MSSGQFRLFSEHSAFFSVSVIQIAGNSWAWKTPVYYRRYYDRLTHNISLLALNGLCLPALYLSIKDKANNRLLPVSRVNLIDTGSPQNHNYRLFFVMIVYFYSMIN